MRRLGRYGPVRVIGATVRVSVPDFTTTCGGWSLRVDPYRRSRPRPGDQHASGSRLERLRARNETSRSVRTGTGDRRASLPRHGCSSCVPTPVCTTSCGSRSVRRTRTGAPGPDLLFCFLNIVFLHRLFRMGESVYRNDNTRSSNPFSEERMFFLGTHLRQRIQCIFGKQCILSS
jgi:hypothetical protein